MVILQTQTADTARSELAGVQDVGWDKGGTVRVEDYNFFLCKKEAKIINCEQDFLYTAQCYKLLREQSLLAIGFIIWFLRSRWCNVIVLNVHALNAEKHDDLEDSFHEELEQASDHFPQYHMKIRSGCRIGGTIWRRSERVIRDRAISVIVEVSLLGTGGMS